MDGKIKRGNPLSWQTGFVGIALIGSGIFFLLVNFSLIQIQGDPTTMIFGILLFVVGIIFSFVQGGGSGLFWMIIPAGVSFTTGAVFLLLGMDQLFSLTGACVTSAGLACTFLLIFLLHNTYWWSLLPAGALAGFPLWVLMVSIQPRIGFHPVVLLFCIGLAFLLIFFSSVQRRKMRFALVTGSIIVTVDILYYLFIAFYEFNLFWAILLVVLGVLLPFIYILYDRRLKRSA
ncbi:MAG: hypothetical protein EHM28_08490 [Spirochaetaceae bacterium]|nr:MAG: hypothetical protein EHM28_08490 [Spirochaetaceae bacterium]